MWRAALPLATTGECVGNTLAHARSLMLTRGSGLLSRLANYIPHRLFGIVPISVGYVEPGMPWDIGRNNHAGSPDYVRGC